MNCKSFYTHDLIDEPSKLRIIFVLESPYSEEVIHGHPVAGTSGLSMSNILHTYFKKIKFGIPLGCQIKNRNIDTIGIINCSNLPLDKSVYGCRETLSKIPIYELDVIKRNPTSKTRRQNEVQNVHSNLLESFKKRVKSISSINASAIFIPCGELARNFIKECGLNNENIYLKTVPHPSHNQWSTQDKFEDYYHFIDLVETKLNES